MRVYDSFDLEASIAKFRVTRAKEAEESYQERLQAIDGEAADLRQNHAIATIADAHGWEHDWSSRATWAIDVQIPMTDLPKARRAFGKFTVYNKWLKDPEKRIVRVTLACEDYPKLRVMYEKVMPCDGSGRCKIVPVLAPAELRYELVCER